MPQDNQGKGDGLFYLKNIYIIMSNVNCPYYQAIVALHKYDGDIVNAVLELQF